MPPAAARCFDLGQSRGRDDDEGQAHSQEAGDARNPSHALNIPLIRILWMVEIDPHGKHEP